MGVTIREKSEADHAAVVELLTRRWTSPEILIEGELIDGSLLPGFLAEDTEGETAGLVTLIKREREWEILTLDSLTRWSGVGTLLLNAVIGSALEQGIRRLMVRTSNDNLDAFRFYQRRGFRIEKIVTGAIDEERRLRPEIPLLGEYGIPIHDEVVFARSL
ncbi:MAG: GNAT family N-acetyltransferase [Stappia sp.]|uniref:GNAT family N-acetyltransferase n=1 Tax=Stappia sp. TaxID=1870903 RepID=UPI000C6ADD24|nr:GNAT family N-acetyltransferase [Stappia sp.]MAB00618.1 GNAT family N-acetyltransferase [Stappia sp.]MBM18688.1 GNAT family N-acetyltransferase [Stappia sp.]|tara:strand:- start:262 stop:744 length:483 start_codon:yes stop_codon:yes gene_type:complete